VSPDAAVEGKIETMTTQKTFKRRVRVRMAKTGESFTAARAQLHARADRQVEPADPPAAATAATAARDVPAPPVQLPMSDQAIRRGTGKGWDEWFAILDAWDAIGHTHPEITGHVHGEHGIDGWWAQSVTTGYERARGRRVKNERPGEGFTVNANRTIGVPIDRLSEAFNDDRVRAEWLADAPIEARTLRAGKSASFAWREPPSRVTVNFYVRGDAKSQAQLQHLRLPDADSVVRFKAYWRERFDVLADLLTD
jgi:hypothetical protein